MTVLKRHRNSDRRTSGARLYHKRRAEVSGDQSPNRTAFCRFEFGSFSGSGGDQKLKKEGK